MRLGLIAAMIVAFDVTALAAAAQPTPAPAVVAPAVTSQERTEVVQGLAQALEAAYYDPAQGRAYAALLRADLAKGAYDNLDDPSALGAKITADLNALSPDGHLRIAPTAAFARPRPPAADAPLSTRISGPPGMEEAKMIGDVAYLRFNQFPDDPKVDKAARDFLLAHADAGAVIIDSRPNRGGGVGVMAAILPLLYAQKTTLVRMDARAGVEEEGPGFEDVLVPQPAPKDFARTDHIVTPDRTETRLQRTPVYYLTSRRSGSAAEHLALAFKRTGRATLVGETTAGANHFGDMKTIGRFTAFIPFGRTYDPDTGKDWEGTGVAPDVAVPADAALDAALALARKAGAHPD